MILRSSLLTLSLSFGLSYAAQMPVNIQDMKPGIVYVSQPTLVPQPVLHNVEMVEVISSEPAPIVAPSEPCQCYCSDVCKDRPREADDTPEWDPVTGRCFCKPRDKANYSLNACHTQPEPTLNPGQGTECCGS